jgi:hypothetical protein
MFVKTVKDLQLRHEIEKELFTAINAHKKTVSDAHQYAVPETGRKIVALVRNEKDVSVQDAERDADLVNEINTAIHALVVEESLGVMPKGGLWMAISVLTKKIISIVEEYDAKK